MNSKLEQKQTRKQGNVLLKPKKAYLKIYKEIRHVRSKGFLILVCFNLRPDN